jgi:hypothetical protein
MQISDIDRGAFWEIGNNSFLDYADADADRLQVIANELRQIVGRAKKQQHEKIEDQFNPLKASR